ncbi:HAD family hydrolase [Lentzea flava]|uniref:Phosphoglycolate phosphatase n=1 Tax=Lentzea flava TaxID=103732 RepID=A0ABQ2UJC0_9PSEU|nr:HAD-IA family hydrolase [Lentzea flava]MCP2200212.1 phosphoglycolate phosphatase [Lentzea flava]GGU40742.1 phosphoglycolate phosphatase [Lentzea flava]
MTIDTVVFDLDGTLVDTVPGITHALNIALRSYVLTEFTDDETRQYVGLGGDALVRAALEKSEASPDLAGEVQEAYLRAYAANPGHLAVVYPGAAELLKRLRARGIRLALCTNKSGRITGGMLRALGLGEAFDAVVSGDELPYRKPDPRHLLEAVRRAGGTAALMLGDSTSDVRAARAAGAPVVCVSFGYGTAGLEPDSWIDSFDDFDSDVLVREALGRDL